METFYVTYDQFWEWFDRPDDQPESESHHNRKRLKIEHKHRSINIEETDHRYSIMYCRHKPGKKNKIWEGDGYLSLVNQVAHLCDLRGRMLEEPTVLDDIDYKAVEELGELLIGSTEVQVVELDKKK